MNEEFVLFFAVPYVLSISEHFKNITKDLNVRLAYFVSIRCVTTLKYIKIFVQNLLVAMLYTK